MAGLDYGSSFRRRENKKEGVTLGKNGKWLVRVRKQTSKKHPHLSVITTIAQYDNKEDAIARYDKETKDAE